mgnify:CR=1 FL=1
MKYGFYDDKDARWIQKEPSLDLYYGKHFEGLPLGYSLEAELGHWREKSVSSTHGEYEATLYHDPIAIGKYALFMNTSYKITKDDVLSVAKQIFDTKNVIATLVSPESSNRLPSEFAM